jgi:hypothetical protein
LRHPYFVSFTASQYARVFVPYIGPAGAGQGRSRLSRVYGTHCGSKHATDCRARLRTVRAGCHHLLVHEQPRPELDDVRRFIAAVRWQFADTMPDWPHEYTIKHWRSDLVDQFEEVCRLICATGVREPWPPAPAVAIYHNHYLVIDRFKYWAIGEAGDSGPIERLSVINRAASPQAGDALVAAEDSRS